jgi:ATPase family associated with various cellular activities (AAA)
MPDQLEPFAGNWTYLRTELVWLDRILSLAVAKQRQETKEINRVARTKSDRVTSHWWKGLVTLDGDAAYDSPAEMPRPSAEATLKLSFQQQLTAKIQVSQQQGICLGLPTLCDRLQLNRFEKNLLLLALAPEINRRYGRLYNYLQDTDQPGATGLPTVDLILRMLCRNDSEWRAARRSLTPGSALMHYPILDMPIAHPESLLTRAVKLADPVVNYLLADQPATAVLDKILAGEGETVQHRALSSLSFVGLAGTSPTPHPANQMLQSWLPTAAPSARPEIADFPLVLPSRLIAQLQHLCDRFQVTPPVDSAASSLAPHLQGAIRLFVGAPGTGKTTAAQAIAQTLQLPLFFADLALIPPVQYEALLQEICDRQPHLVLLRSAHALLNRSAQVSETLINQFFHQRSRDHSITLLTLTTLQSIKSKWRQKMPPALEFLLPTMTQRQQLWTQALTHTDLVSTADFQILVQVKLTGGEIHAIAHEASVYAAIAEQPLTIDHLRQALAQFGKRL